MKRKALVLAALILAFAMAFAGVTSASATPHVFEDGTTIGTPEKPTKGKEQICPPLTSGKIDVGPGTNEVTITADPGYVLTSYCVKAGSSNQDDGPITLPIPGENVTTYTFTYPGKEISHYSFEQMLIVAPAQTPINEQPEAPTGFDYCGTLFDTPSIPLYTASSPFTVQTTVEGNVTTVELIPFATHFFASGIITKWPFTYTDVPCPMFIVEQPAAPTLCLGQVILPADTDDYYYGGDGFNVFGIAKAGRLFVQDLLENDLDYIVWPIKDLKETCETSEEPVVVVPPVTPVQPVVEAPLVVQVPPAVDGPPATVVPPVVVPPVVVSPIVTPPVVVVPNEPTSVVSKDDPTNGRGFRIETALTDASTAPSGQNSTYLLGGVLAGLIAGVLFVGFRNRLIPIKK